MHLWNERKAVQTVRDNRNQPELMQQHMHWQNPQHGWLKCNVDAAFQNEIEKTSAGWCIRDHLGQFVLAVSSWVQGRYAVIEGEAVALLGPIKELSQTGFKNVIFEPDSKYVADAIHKLNDIWCV
jgi:hypothetical protein